MVKLVQDQDKKAISKDAMKQTSLPWSKDQQNESSLHQGEDLSKCRVVHVTKRILFKGAATGEFMVLKPNNVRTVASGAVVRVVLINTDPEVAATSTASPVVATAVFCANVKITTENLSQYFNLHITSPTDFDIMNQKGTMVGWHFKKLSLLPAIQWVVGTTRQDCFLCSVGEVQYVQKMIKLTI